MLHKYKTDSKRIYQVMKEMSRIQKAKSNPLHREINIYKAITQTAEARITQEFNKYFTSIGSTLQKMSPITKKTFQDFVTSHNKKIFLWNEILTN